MTRSHARSARGQRAEAIKPPRKGGNITMIGAVDLFGVIAMMTIEGNCTGEVFQAFVEQVLVPELLQGDVVVLDNSSIHTGEGVREAIEAAGAQLLYLPPYHPELNPIEECWSKIKAWLRKVGARSYEALSNALVDAMDRVTPSNMAGWYRHAGYSH